MHERKEAGSLCIYRPAGGEETGEET